MGIFGKSKGELLAEIAKTGVLLAAVTSERDGYREDALKYRRNVANLVPGGKPRKAANGEARV